MTGHRAAHKRRPPSGTNQSRGPQTFLHRDPPPKKKKFPFASRSSSCAPTPPSSGLLKPQFYGCPRPTPSQPASTCQTQTGLRNNPRSGTREEEDGLWDSSPQRQKEEQSRFGGQDRQRPQEEGTVSRGCPSQKRKLTARHRPGPRKKKLEAAQRQHLCRGEPKSPAWGPRGRNLHRRPGGTTDLGRGS